MVVLADGLQSRSRWGKAHGEGGWHKKLVRCAQAGRRVGYVLKRVYCVCVKTATGRRGDARMLRFLLHRRGAA